MLLLSKSNSTLVLIRSISTSSKLSSNQVRRVNKRTESKKKEVSLNKLINLYHLSATFAPLNQSTSTSTLDSFINHNLIPADRQYSRLPETLNLFNLTRSNSDLNHEIEKLNQSSTASTSSLMEIGLNKSILNQNLTSSSTVTDSRDETFDKSFLKNFTLGSEPPLNLKLRKVIDTLYGTESGTQAGLTTVEENGQEILELERIQKSERLREEAEEEEELAKDRLEAREA